MTSTVQMPSSSPQNTPEITVLTRVASIPLVASVIEQVNTTLVNNRYTCTPYTTAKGLSTSAYNSAYPYAAPLAPWITSADNMANKAVDAIQTRYPYPFQAQPADVTKAVADGRESVAQYVNKRTESVTKLVGETRENANKAAVAAAIGIDQRLAPLVDLLESTAVTRLNTSAPADSQYQVQRVYELSKNVTGQLYEYSNQTILVQRATETANSVVELAQIAGARIDALSNRLVNDLRALQTSLAATGTSVHNSVNQYNAAVSQEISAISQEIGTNVATLRDILSTPDITAKEKLSRVGAQVEWTIRPLLDRAMALVSRRSEGNAGATMNGDAH